jgi:hypothetical protein
VIVAIGNEAGGEPWQRLPLLALAIVPATAAFGAFGVLLGTLGRESGTAMLLAFLLALPLSLLGAVPESVDAAAWVGDLFPFGHAADVFSSVLYDADPARALAREVAWLVALTIAYGVLARVGIRRLLA